jgi:S-DNA-T family DNA segregation ATPase FtsK/SpoIIIE
MSGAQDRPGTDARHLHLVTGKTLVQADPVYDGELVDDEHVPSVSPDRTFTSWWQRSRHVPRSVRSWAAARQAIRDGVVRLIRSPWRFIGSVSRGTVLTVRGWRRWVRVHDYRDAAEQSEKLADKFTEIRALTLFRWKVTGALTCGLAVALGTVSVIYGAIVWWVAVGVGSVVLAIAGRRKDGAPGRKAVLAGPRTLTWTMDPQVLVDAFRDAKLIGKDESLRLVERASRQGEGWAITVDLPATRKAADVIKHREALASALAVDEVQLIAERVRGAGWHCGWPIVIRTSRRRCRRPW